MEICATDPFSVFLDCCETYHYDLFQMFGAAPQEVPQQYFVDDNAGFLDVSWYSANGLRPAAFMGNLRIEPNGYIAIPPDMWGQQPISRTIEAVANWHAQFLASWTTPGRQLGVYDAQKEADLLAWKQATGKSDSGNPKPPTPTQVAVDPVTGAAWDPVTCLKIGGYLGLQFNGYNHAGDWQPQ